jgi:Sortilin, neurotensin receptor 3, C-terminal
MIEPKGASERFVLYGTRLDPANPESNNRVGVVFTLDFSQLHTRACSGEDSAGTETSDYERWAPSATAKGDSCLMGRRVEYTRRKRDRACHNSDDIEIAHFVSNCECTDRDWECDRGYKRFPIDGGVCVRDPEVPIDLAHLVPHYCRPGLHYHVSNGYRKVAGDSCSGGVQHEMSLLPCPGSSWHHSVSHGGWTVMLLLIGLCGSLAAVTYCQFASASSRAGYGSGKGGFLNASGKGRSAGPTFSSLPPVLAKPLAVTVGVVIAAGHVIASSTYHGMIFVIEAVQCNKKGSTYGNAAGNIGGGGSAGSGFSSRGFGIPAFSGTSGSGATYNQMGKERVDTAEFEDDDDNAARDDEESGAMGRRRKVGGSGGSSYKDDAGDDDDDDNDGEQDKEGDLLGLGDPLTGSGGSGSSLGGDPLVGNSSSGARSTPSAKVPTLRPPRSHEGKKA